MSTKKTKSTYFDPVDPRVDFAAEEKKLLKNWDEKKVVQKYLTKNNKSSKRFSFMDGPITANNPMGVHHAWGRTYKDIFQRYKNMKGFRQRFQNGFDSQGLWVEVEVEKDLGFKNKKDIEDYGVAKFVAKCKSRVKKFANMQTEQSKRLGYFMDWDNSYFTMSDENNYMIWYFIKKCHENGWLYKGKDSVPWCPRCETAISQHEILTEDYREVDHESIYFALPLVGQEEYLLVWTTTPWTIPANIAVALSEDMDYSLVAHGDNKYWVATETVERVFKGEKKIIERTVKGNKLVGFRYESPFDDLPAVKKVKEGEKFHSVIATDDRIMPVTSEEGTGLVHTAVSAGAEDFRLGQKLGLPMIPVIADNADYLEGLGELAGKNAKEDPGIVFAYMKKKGKNFIFKIEKYGHRYPGCWRCKTELVWKVTDEWYIAMDEPLKTKHGSQSSKEAKEPDTRTLRERMINVARKIEWIPGFGLKRELDWLNNMQDWLISKKNRFWGLCLPIWECKKCGGFEVVGGKEELKEKASTGWEKFSGRSPHKPYVDEVKLKCTECGGEMVRIEPVGSPWLDAGIVSFSTITKDNKGEPLYTENRKRWEKWFPANFITESFPGQFKNWFYAMIAMSTVLEDTNPFETVLGFATLLGEDGEPMHKSSNNSVEFNEGAEKIGVDVMRWMYLRQDPKQNLLFGYKTGDEVRRQFHLKLWNIYNFFVTYSNLDGWTPEKRNTKASSKKYNKLDDWLLERLAKTTSVVGRFLDKYDAKAATEAIEEFVNDFSNWYIRRSRDRVGPTAESVADKNSFYSTTYFTLVALMKVLAPFIPFMTDMIYKNLTKEVSVHLANWHGVRTSSRLAEDMQTVRAVVEVAHSIRKQKEIPVRQPLSSVMVSTKSKKPQTAILELLMDEINVKEVEWEEGDESVRLDAKITKPLEEEARTRELARKIQIERKKMGTGLTDEVIVVNIWFPKREDLLLDLKRRTLAKEFKKGAFKVTKA